MCVWQRDIARPYRAVHEQDKKYDGIFYYGTKGTKVYCRPSCKMAQSSWEDCSFFTTITNAKIHGFEACTSCQPDRLGSDLSSEILKSIDAGAINEQGVRGLADALHISERHLRRLVQAQTGTSPLHLNRNRRLNAAKTLVVESSLPIIDIAFIVGFSSLRQFNDVYKDAFNISPRETRKAAH